MVHTTGFWTIFVECVMHGDNNLVWNVYVQYVCAMYGDSNYNKYTQIYIIMNAYMYTKTHIHTRTRTHTKSHAHSQTYSSIQAQTYYLLPLY